MTDLTELQQNIQKILQESSYPLGPSKIGEKLGLSKERSKGKIHYNLKKLVEKEIVVCSEEGKYSINKDKLEIIRVLENEILNLLSVKEYYPKELAEELGQDERTIIGAISFLELYGLIKEGDISLKKRGGIPKKGFTCYVTDYCRASTYTPTHIGYSKIDFCPVCKEKLNDYETIVIAFFKHPDDVQQKPWISTRIHSKCLPDSKAYEIAYGRYESSMFCYRCGLPLTSKMLPDYPITYELLKDHFFGFELKSIQLFEALRQSWIVDLNIPFLKKTISISPQNSTIKKVYNKVEVEIPEWLNERINKDENNSEMTPFGEICHEISNDMMFTFDGDISKLETAEKFQKLLIKYCAFFPEEYEVNARIKEIWTAAQAIKKTYVENIQNSYEKLLGPEASVYSCIDEVFDSESYDFDKVRSNHICDLTDSPTFTHTFAIKCGAKYFHPYCADKLGLNDNHCNDNNSKGGEKK